MDDAFVGGIVGVGEERAPRRIGHLVDVDGEAVVLRRDEAAPRVLVGARLVDAAIAVLHLERGKAGGQR